ncbi:Scy1p SCDLUD_001063 [Saccharomycodes ludwigii]|uniref:Scy1p n=1 Tax=Saccharomycodes ludwigii TaxID=36035 RepID=UPI001E863963|nr:hypothetical protein SCDLUD_001063 [Saccharomycodes ludwigii]KAH3903425.1 hypothetical protein SCDLUD_001063 [Saccharomycodes ludwigii]
MLSFFSGKNGINANYSYTPASPTFIAEPWSVYTAKPKSSSKFFHLEKCSVFLFDKKKFENYLLKSGIIASIKKDQKVIKDAYDLLKTQVGNISKLKHPNILTIIEPIEEHSKNFLFVTEYVSGSLYNVFGDNSLTNATSGNNEENDFFQQRNDSTASANDLMFQRGIFQTGQALQFIHDSVSSVCLDLQPKSIFINEKGDWKVAGLGHLVKLPQGTSTADYNLPQYDPRTPQFMHLNYDYTAPELIFENTLSFKNDYFSIGCIVYFLYYGKPLFRSEGSISSYKDDYAKFERKLSQLSWNQLFLKIPESIRSGVLPQLMNRDIYMRYGHITDFLNDKIFQNPLIKTLIFLDDLPTKTVSEKEIFFKGLIDILPKFPNTMLHRKFLPLLTENLDLSYNEKSDFHSLIPIFLQLILTIANNLSQLSFQEKILPFLKMDYLLQYDSAPILYKNLTILKSKIKSADFTENFLKPLLEFTVNKQVTNVRLHEMALEKSAVELMLDSFDFSSVKKFYFPLMSNLFSLTTNLNVKIGVTKCFYTMIENKSIDKYQALDDMLPLFTVMKSKDRRILLEMVPIFEKLSSFVSDEVIIVDKILPLIWRFSMADTLNLKDYERFTMVINGISMSVQKKHLQTLKQRKEYDVPGGNTSDGNNAVNTENNFFGQVIEKPVVKKNDIDRINSANIKITPIKPKKVVPTVISNNSTNATNDKNKSIARGSPLVLSRDALFNNNGNNNNVNSNSINYPNDSNIWKNKSTTITSNKRNASGGNNSKTAIQFSDNNTNNDEFGDFFSNSTTSSKGAGNSYNFDYNAPKTSVSTTSSIVSNTTDTINNSRAGNNKTLPPGFSVTLLQPNNKLNNVNSNTNSNLKNDSSINQYESLI